MSKITEAAREALAKQYETIPTYAETAKNIRKGIALAETQKLAIAALADILTERDSLTAEASRLTVESDGWKTKCGQVEVTLQKVYGQRDKYQETATRLKGALEKADNLFMDNGTISAAEYKIIETGKAIRSALSNGEG